MDDHVIYPADVSKLLCGSVHPAGTVRRTTPPLNISTAVYVTRHVLVVPTTTSLAGSMTAVPLPGPAHATGDVSEKTSKRIPIPARCDEKMLAFILLNR